MKKIEFKKKAYQKPEILAVLDVEVELMTNLSGWNEDGGGDGGEIIPDPEPPGGGDDGDDWGGT